MLAQWIQEHKNDISARRCYLLAHGRFQQVLLLLLRLLLWWLLSALTCGSLWTLAFPDRALLVGQTWGSAVFDGQLSCPMLPPPVARLWWLEEIATLWSRFSWSGWHSSGADGQLMGGLWLDTMGGRWGNRALSHGLDCGGRCRGQGRMGGPSLGGHAHHLLLLLEVILKKKSK